MRKHFSVSAHSIENNTFASVADGDVNCVVVGDLSIGRDVCSESCWQVGACNGEQLSTTACHDACSGVLNDWSQTTQDAQQGGQTDSTVFYALL